MEKKFEVIPVENYGVVVHKDFTIVGKPAFLQSEKGNCNRGFTLSLNSTSDYMCDPIGVIATINKRIDDIPLIEIDNDKEILNAWSNRERKDSHDYLTFRLGYKAANKGYSEEDMRKAMKFAWTCGLDKKDRAENFFLQSLQPKLPKSVVLEMELNDPYEEHNIQIFTLKITNPSTNTIIPISYE